jgi:hypothetical protein
MLTLCIAVGGCSTSASMRIEVEVYKGPLARTFEAQVGELNGTIEVAHANLEAWRSRDQLDKKPGDSGGRQPVSAKEQDLSAYQAPTKRISDDLAALTCARLGSIVASSVATLLQTLSQDTTIDMNKKFDLESAAAGLLEGTDAHKQLWLADPKKLQPLESALSALEDRTLQIPPPVTGATPSSATQTGDFKRWSIEFRRRESDSAVKQSQIACPNILLRRKDHREAAKAFAIQVSNVAMRMVGLATSITTSELFAFSPPARRQKLVKLATLLGESSNQLAARVDALLRQVSDKDTDPDKAALRRSTSEHLRDASVTEFLSLLDWFDVANISNGDERYADVNMNASERVTLARQLFADQYWTKINDVYSSGQGDVRMALIKDDIGNWSQKSFDNDPSKLLDAYRNVGLAALNTLAKVARGGNSVDNLQMLSDLATNRLGAKQAAGEVSADLQRERERTLARLEKLQTDSSALVSKYQAGLETSRAELAGHTSTLEQNLADSEQKRKVLDDTTKRYLAAIDAGDDQVLIEELKQQRADAQASYSAAATQAQESQLAVTEARRKLDEVEQPYERQMQALVDAATNEVETLARVSSALEESAAARPLASASASEDQEKK